MTDIDTTKIYNKLIELIKKTIAEKTDMQLHLLKIAVDYMAIVKEQIYKHDPAIITRFDELTLIVKGPIMTEAIAGENPFDLLAYIMDIFKNFEEVNKFMELVLEIISNRGYLEAVTISMSQTYLSNILLMKQNFDMGLEKFNSILDNFAEVTIAEYMKFDKKTLISHILIHIARGYTNSLLTNLINYTISDMDEKQIETIKSQIYTNKMNIFGLKPAKIPRGLNFTVGIPGKFLSASAILAILHNHFHIESVGDDKKMKSAISINSPIVYIREVFGGNYEYDYTKMLDTTPKRIVSLNKEFIRSTNTINEIKESDENTLRLVNISETYDESIVLLEEYKTNNKYFYRFVYKETPTDTNTKPTLWPQAKIITTTGIYSKYNAVLAKVNYKNPKFKMMEETFENIDAPDYSLVKEKLKKNIVEHFEYALKLRGEIGGKSIRETCLKNIPEIANIYFDTFKKASINSLISKDPEYLLTKLSSSYKGSQLFISEFKKRFDVSETTSNEKVLTHIARVCDEIIKKFDQAKIWRLAPTLKEYYLSSSYI